MRLLLPAAAALLASTFAAHADTLSEAFTAGGPSTYISNNNYAVVASSRFSQFNPSLGALNSITIALSGTYSGEPGFGISSIGASPVDDPKQILVPG